ncbi:hypothetical protein MauCBS54593_002628 [Microsporum audouinii]
MVALISFVVAALAGTALARPGYKFPELEVRGTGGHHHHPPPMTTGNPPEPTTSNPPGPGTQTITTTQTDTITLTTFVPHSTAVATIPGHTWYSTWLEASTYTTTTCYPVTETPQVPEPTPTQPPETCHGNDCEGEGNGHGSEYTCPPPATVTVTVTECRGDGCEQPPVTPPPAGPTHCPSCQTYTITDIHEGTNTIVVPPQTILPPPGQCDRCQTYTITDIHEGTKTITIPPETTISTVTPPTSNPQPTGTGTGTGPQPSEPGTTYTLPTLTPQQPSGTGSPQRRWWI